MFKIAAYGACFIAGAFAAELVRRSPLPFPDRGFRIFASPNVEAQQAVVEVLRANGLKPQYQIDSTDVKRVAMSDGTIINVTDPALHAVMGHPACGIALVTSNPWLAAENAASSLRTAGFQAKVLGELDQDVPTGNMVFVATDALTGTVLVFRKSFRHMGPRPPRWTSPTSTS